jgi:hypothetical protein
MKIAPVRSIIIAVLFLLPLFAHAQTSVTTGDVYEKAQVTSVLTEAPESTPDTSVTSPEWT